jgi:hypothetical protein
MAIQLSPIKLEKPALSGQSTRFSPPHLDQSYFEKLAAFGIACLAAAIVGKLVMAALTPQHKRQLPNTLEQLK